MLISILRDLTVSGFEFIHQCNNEKLSSFFQGGVRQAQFEILFLVKKNAWREVVNISVIIDYLLRPSHESLDNHSGVSAPLNDRVIPN